MPELNTIPEETIEKEEKFIGAITIGDSHTTRSISEYARCSKQAVIPARSMRLVQTDVQSTIGEDWVITRSFSSRPSREWIVPNGLMRVFKNGLHIPVVNLSNQLLK